MKCPKCQTENPEESAYYRKCRQPLSNKLVCPKCNHINLADSVFCNKCGYSLGTPQTSQPQTAAPSPPSLVPPSFANGRYQVKKFLGKEARRRSTWPMTRCWTWPVIPPPTTSMSAENTFSGDSWADTSSYPLCRASTFGKYLSPQLGMISISCVGQTLAQTRHVWQSSG